MRHEDCPQPNRKLIGLSGFPGHGKSTVQDIITRVFDVEPIDDGLPIRMIAMGRHNLSWEDVSTQRGKSSLICIDGVQIPVRRVLGEIGNEYEVGNPNYWIDLSIAQLKPDQARVSFGSVRRDQGRSITRLGGIVLEVCNPWRAVSAYEFDQYNRANVTHKIVNDGDLDNLESQVVPIVRSYLES